MDKSNGAACIGILEIPAIDLKLPVLSEWSYPFLKRAPCRYSGSAYLDNLVITAHNYRTYFGKLKELEVGTEVIFTDAAGNRFEYKVAAVEALTPQSVKDMTSGEWALSLFTCTLDGKNRVTVRCEAAGCTSCEQ
ncbi:sortase [Ruminococcus sp. AF25-13]|nr:sortase [Ruminococcus sp. TF10-6]RGG29018.1 sortase [Ruminococcus sp. AF25-13]RGI15119.1 sortase [Ruminococcus sp. TF10-12AC]